MPSKIETYDFSPPYSIRGEVEIAHNNSLIDKLVLYARNMKKAGIRKERHTIQPGESFPPPFDETFEALQEKLRIRRPGYNTLIFKRYEQGGSSDAFEFHVDPKDFLGIDKDFILYSPVGEAIFNIRDDQRKVTSWFFYRDSALLIPGWVPVEHNISKPHPKRGIDGERLLAFFGQSAIPLLGAVDVYNPQKQRDFQYESPIPLRPGTRLERLQTAA